MPTTLQLNNVLQALSQLALTDINQIWDLPPAQLEAALFDLMPDLVDTWSLAASTAAADWYDDLRDSAEIGGRFAAIVEQFDDLGAEALAGWGTEPLRLDEPDVIAARSRIEGGLQKRLVNSANRTVTGSAVRDPKARGYQRRTRGGACKFCVMVASRGAVYTEASARFACHEHCYCEAVPAWGGRALPVAKYKRSDRPQSAKDRARVRKWIADNL